VRRSTVSPEPLNGAPPDNTAFTTSRAPDPILTVLPNQPSVAPKQQPAEIALASTAVHERHAAPPAVAIDSDSCGGCGVQLAADQRYCVECGHPRRAARIPILGDAGPPAEPAWADAPSPSPSPSPLRASGRLAGWASLPNATAFAAIGALLLAMGVGVLIGRSGRAASTDSAADRTTTVVLSGTGASVAASPTVAPTAAAQGTTAGAGATSTKKPAAKKAAAVTTAPVKAVHIGSSGSGPGYTNHKFTGNFFGGG
jgi:hypothetical protein